MHHVVLVAVAALILSRGLARRAQKELSTDERDRYFAVLGQFRSYYIGWLILLGIAVLLPMRLPDELGQSVFGIAFAVLLLGAGMVQGLTLARLRKANMPATFLRRYALARSIAFAGVLILLAFVLIRAVF